MKLLFVLLLFTTPLYAKNKVLFTVCVNCVPNTKEEPLFDLYVMADFKKQNIKKTLESRGRFAYGSSEDCIAYIRRDEKTNPLYVITDFVSFNKVKIADEVMHFEMKEGILYFEKMEGVGERAVKVLYAITDFKNLTKIEVNRGYGEFITDQY